MKRVIFFLFMLFQTIFMPWYFLFLLAAVFVLFFKTPFEIAFIGLFYDSIVFASAPNIFTIGFLSMATISETTKSLINPETRLGKIIIFCSSLAAFLLIYFYYFYFKNGV